MKLPYLKACVKEGMRVHPSVGFPLPREVPEGGRDIAGKYFPAGCKVGINAAVLHYDKDVFGADADEYSPDRWMGDTANMDHYMMHFGAGKRSCLGKNVSATAERTSLKSERANRVP